MADTDFLVSEAQLALDQARKVKAGRTRDLGSPIQLSGKALAITILDGNAWIGDNTTAVRKIDLETGKTLQIYKGHKGPVTSLTFLDAQPGTQEPKILITGSWDKTIKLWNTETTELISSTDAHSDFVKSLYVFQSLQLLVSGGSDNIVRFWDLSSASPGAPLKSAGSISSHTRPVECLAGRTLTDSSVELYTGDTMGVIRLWTIAKELTTPPRWKSTMKAEFKDHRTRINEIHFGNDQLWTASSDDTVKVLTAVESAENAKSPPSITHPVAVRSLLPLSLTDLAEPYLITGAGDTIRIYDVSSLEEPELINKVDAHWHDVTGLRLWVRKATNDDGQTTVEPWIVSTSLDSTIRKWRLSELLKPEPKAAVAEVKKPAAVERGSQSNPDFEMTEEEERELAELLGDDDEEEDYSRFNPEDLSKPSLMTKRSREDLRGD